LASFGYGDTFIIICLLLHPNLFKNAKKAAYSIIEAKGYTNFAIGLATSKITEAILRDEHSILPVSSILEGEYGIMDVALSLPCVVGRNGIERRIKVNMLPDELLQFRKSADHLKEVIKRTQINL